MEFLPTIKRRPSILGREDETSGSKSFKIGVGKQNIQSSKSELPLNCCNPKGTSRRDLNKDGENIYVGSIHEKWVNGHSIEIKGVWGGGGFVWGGGVGCGTRLE